MNIAVITGSRADYGMLEWPLKVLRDDPYFSVAEWNIWGATADQALVAVKKKLEEGRPDVVMLLGDRFEIMGAAWACHLERVPVAHLCGGDVTEGSYDDAMRDCISRMASIHFVTSTSAMARLTAMGLHNVHLVGSTGIDFIKHFPWKRERPIEEPYIVISYQPETIDGTNEFEKLVGELDMNKHWVFVGPNADRGSSEIYEFMKGLAEERPRSATFYGNMPHADFLNLIHHCEYFVGNSSSMIYEAPEMGVKTRMIGKRQRGRVIPWGDANASKRIAKVLRYSSL